MSAGTRYASIPMRPEATDDWSLSELADLVTSEALTGVALASAPT